MVKGEAKKATLYLCDPSKNTACEKTACQNPCKMTAKKEFAKTDSDGKEIVSIHIPLQE